MKNDLILLVEDNPDDAELTIDAFRRGGIVNDVLLARDGAEALDCVHPAGASNGDVLRRRPGLMVLDLNLPRLGGLEVLKRVRADARTRLLPVVVLTTSGEDRDVIESYRLGANAYVRKPVAFEDFVEVAERLGRFWMYDNLQAPTSD